MCVASYGVIPQTYIRAVPDGGTSSTSPPVAESWTLTSGARLPITDARSGTSGADQARMRRRLTKRGSDLERRPGQRRPPRTLLRKTSGPQQSVDPTSGGPDLLDVQQRPQRFAGRTVQAGCQVLQRCPLLLPDRLTAETPQDGAQLVVDVEADAVVDPVPMTVGHRQHVAALAIGVVDDDV